MEYYVHLGDETLQKLGNAISGEPVEVVELNVTENDTYTAPSGKAYSPVTVNVSGGSSDFSTAEVTINVQPTAPDTFMIAIPNIFESALYSALSEAEAAGKQIVPLYNGEVYATSASGNIVFSNGVGDVEIIGGGTLRIFGNCSVDVDEDK